MLINFTVSNFLSFDTPASFSMEAGRKTTRHEQHVRLVSGIPVLRGAVIYGANAAGKSNLLKAVDVFCRMFVEDDCSILAGLQFMLGDHCNSDSTFDIVYSSHDKVFRYQVVTDGRSVKYESLDLVVAEKSEQLFKRRAGEEIEFGSMIADCEWYRQRTLAANRLFLSKLMEDGLIENQGKIVASEVFLEGIKGLWGLQVIGAESKPRPIAFFRYFQQAKFKKFLLALLQRADLGVTDVTWTPLTKKEVELLIQNNPLLRFGVHIVGIGRAFVLIRNDDNGTSGEELQLVHNGTALRAESESDGTVRLLHLSPMLYEIHYGNGTWFIDEADCHLHPLLTRYLLRAFMGSECADSQIVVTMHDTTLMTHDIWRTDEVWFAEKRVDGSTDLYSLYQF